MKKLLPLLILTPFFKTVLN